MVLETLKNVIVSIIHSFLSPHFTSNKNKYKSGNYVKFNKIGAFNEVASVLNLLPNFSDLQLF